MATNELVPIFMAHFTVTIHKGMMRDKHFYWTATTDDHIGINGGFYQSAYVQGAVTPEEAIKNWEDFATTNLISSYALLRNIYTDDILNKQIQHKE